MFSAAPGGKFSKLGILGSGIKRWRQIREIEVQRHAFLLSVLHRAQWQHSHTHLRHFYSRKTMADTHWLARWVTRQGCSWHTGENKKSLFCTRKKRFLNLQRGNQVTLTSKAVFPEISVRGLPLSSKYKHESSNLAHINIECPDDTYTKFKICISKVILYSYEL